MILNEFGLLYKTKSPDKISLIQSASLFNAAIVRQPLKQKFQDDLHQLCEHVLHCAKARDKDANLVKFSQTVACRVKKMRNNAFSHLETIRQISDKTEFQKVKVKKQKDFIQRVRELLLDYQLITKASWQQFLNTVSK